MKVEQSIYLRGDWIVHARYGVGQVQGIEKKALDGKQKLFFKVKTFDGVYWLPVVNTEVDYIRPITNEGKIKRALTVIRKPPEQLSSNHFQRSRDISEALSEISLLAKARMIRDLHGKQEETKLNLNEENALAKMKRQFLNEWSVVEELDMEVLEERLEQALAASVKKRSSVAA